MGGRPTTARLTLFFAVYAIGFGNHLSMILLAPAYALFLVIAAPRGWRAVLAPRVVALALVCAALGALQYAWSLRNLWLLPQPPHGVVDALQRFWFDVTKSDWRDTMVLRTPRSMLADRAAMYWFDLRQQCSEGGVGLRTAYFANIFAAEPRYLIRGTTINAELAEAAENRISLRAPRSLP